MNLTILMIGKTADSYLQTGIEIFTKRIQHYLSIRLNIIPDLKDRKNLSASQVKEKEAILLMKELTYASTIVLLDENGSLYSSVEFSNFFQKQMNSGTKELFFVIGGAYGVDESIKKKAHFTISLSKMTFTHQMIRLLLTEQIYRSMTILKNEQYHNE
ncbi:MAG: 23S rRNA (pseudouridine(1915)-N(3))-methyltransferase RlmH [Bacteroidales bacterium]|nr:23S rRNA (pseudouridine(1915)-N(3))-methyltransferase RlmH [Bacteroidales bacterium]